MKQGIQNWKEIKSTKKWDFQEKAKLIGYSKKKRGRCVSGKNHFGNIKEVPTAVHHIKRSKIPHIDAPDAY